MVTQTTNELKLTDAITRHQAYLEGLKLHQGAKFRVVIEQLRDELRRIFFEIDYDDLGQMSRRELEDFVRQLRTSQIQNYSTFRQQLLNDLRSFVDADKQITKAIVDEAKPEDDNGIPAILASTGAIWALYNSTRVPANGKLPSEFMDAFEQASVEDIVQTLRQAHAAKLSVTEAKRLFFGFKGRGGSVRKLNNWANAMIATLLQHSTSIVNQSVAGAIFERYQWVAILDNATSDICRSRHEKIYRYGEGPLPPAHMHCRSRVIPVGNAAEDVPDTFYAWIRQQPVIVQNDLLGRKKAQDLRAGRLGATRVRKFDDAKPLTLAQFVDKLRFMLAT